jgi:hypothetical protein
MRLKYKNTSPFLLLFFALIAFSCELGDSPSDEDLNALPNSWVIEKVLIDGLEDIATDYSNFRLTILADSSYILRNIYGTEEQGQWSVTNGTQLMLTTNQEGKQYIIISLAADELILLFKDEFFKESEANFEYTLVPE